MNTFIRLLFALTIFFPLAVYVDVEAAFAFLLFFSIGTALTALKHELE